MHEFPGSTRKAAFGAIIVDVDVEPKEREGNVSKKKGGRYNGYGHLVTFP